MDVFNKCLETAKRSEPARAAGVYPYYRVISSAQEPVVNHEGRELVMLGSNNYLGLTNHPEVKDAAAMALAIYGTGCAGSRLLNGTLDVHVQLESRLAEFMQREAALVFSTGFQVNLGVISVIAGKNDVIFPAEGAHPYLRDLEDVEFHLLDTGHFALEEDGDRIARLMTSFLDRKVKVES